MDFEKAMQFILDTQARLEASVYKHDERIAELESLVKSNTGMIRQLVDVTMSLTHHAEATSQSMEDIGRELRELGKETDRRIKELIEAGAHTDQRLDAMIDVVDKLIHRNGGASQR